MCALYNLGSVAVDILNRYEISNTVSGALLKIVDEERIFIEQYTGLSVGSVSIDEKWQGALINLSAAAAFSAMNTEGVDVNSISLGEFSIGKGGETNLEKSAADLRSMAMEKLKRLGSTVRFKRVIG